jgi:hypothetical protein
MAIFIETVIIAAAVSLGIIVGAQRSFVGS